MTAHAMQYMFQYKGSSWKSKQHKHLNTSREESYKITRETGNNMSPRNE